MYEDGYKNITNIDLSSFAIQKMINQQEEKGYDMKCIAILIIRGRDGCSQYVLS